MKRLIKMCAGLLGAWLAFILIYQVTLMWNPYAMQKKTRIFLDSVQDQKYEEAAGFFDGTKTDKANWAQEMRRLNEETGFKLLSYKNVKAEYDDGAFNTGHVDLIYEVDGVPLEVNAILTFSSDARPKQVCAILPSGKQPGSISELAAWNQLNCGGSF